MCQKFEQCITQNEKTKNRFLSGFNRSYVYLSIKNFAVTKYTGYDDFTSHLTTRCKT